VYDDTTADGDPAYKAPKCPENVEGCSSCGLLDGNGNGGYPEPNQPNTLYGLVQDIPGTGANAPIRVISIQVETMSESGFIQSGPSAGDQRNIKVTVRAWGNNPDQWIDVFYTSDANAGFPGFTLGSYRWDCGGSSGWVSPVVSGTVMCSRIGNETTISFLMTLPAVNPPRKMAIRARIRNSPKSDIGGWLDGWAYRKAITINNSLNSNTLTDYQVLVINPIYNETGLVGSWHFNEGSGTVAYDSSGNNNNGTLVNSPTWVDGKFGKALSFDGIDDYVNISNFGTLNGSFTISFFIKFFNAPNKDAYIIFCNDDNCPQVWLSWDDAKLRVYISPTNAGPKGNFNNWQNNTWYHIVVTYNKNTGILTYFINGIVDAQFTGITTNFDESKITNLYVGCVWSSTICNAVIDEVRIYNRALSAEEIQALYQAKARLDYGDIRFTDSDGSTLLNYWQEADGRFWVKVPSIPASSTKTIYVYYGNPSATSLSNGPATFIFFDDFSTDPANRWKDIFRYAGDAANEFYWDGEKLYLTKAVDNRGGGGTMVLADPSWENTWGIRFKFKAGGGTGADGLAFGFFHQGNAWNGGTSLSVGQSGYAVEIDNYQSTNDATANHIAIVRTSAAEAPYGYTHLARYDTNATEDDVWHSVEVKFYNDNIKVWLDGTLILDYSTTFDKTYKRFLFGAATGGATNNHIIDDIIIRKYTSPEPTAGVGAEETGEYTFANYWRYRRAIEIDNRGNTNTLTDYQVLVQMDTASLISGGKMRGDCGDIRFTDTDGETLLSYWIEEGCNTANTRIWVKVPTIPASSTKTIYVYYGNPSATSLSDAENTFTETGTFYHTRYSTSDPNSLTEGISMYNSAQDMAGYCWRYISHYSNISNKATCSSGSYSNIAYWIEAFFYVDVPGIWEFRFGVDYGRGGGLYIDGEVLEEAWTADLWWNYNWNSAGVLKGSKYLTTGWHKLFSLGFEDCCDGNTQLQFKKPFGDWTTWSTTNLRIKSRKYTTPEPTTSFGAEETGEYTFANYWRYRRAITIDNSGNPNTLTDYQVLVQMDTASLISGGKMRGDCGDIRFTDEDGQTLLSYWIESGCNTASTRIWVKVPSIPGNSTKTIYVYYGNPDAGSQSDGYAVFDFFDDFIDNRNNWVVKSGTGSITTVDGITVLSYTGGGCQYVVETAKPVTTPAILEARLKSYSAEPANGGFDWPMVTNAFGADECGGTSGDWYLYAPLSNNNTAARLWRHSGTVYTNLVNIASSHPVNTWVRWKLIRNGRYTAYYLNDVKIWEYTDTVDISPGPGYIAWREGEVYIDWIFVRKYTSPEPTASVGAEETTIEDNDDLVFTVQNPPSSFTCGIYESNFKAPVCYGDGWCGTCNAVPCRDTTSDSAESPDGFYNCGGNEPNQPNTLFSQCQDTSENTAGSLDEQIRRINIKSLAPSGKFEGGELVEASLLVACRSDDQIVIAYASGVTYSPTQLANWRYLTTISCPYSAPITYWYNLHYTLRLDNVEGWHAVRAVLGRCPGCATQTSICPSMTFQDADDFVFYVKSKAPSSLPVCAVYDSSYKTPRCPAGTGACSTCDLIKSRHGI
jgi:hypothetical protein